jgi:hypothetical protein
MPVPPYGGFCLTETALFLRLGTKNGRPRAASASGLSETFQANREQVLQPIRDRFVNVGISEPTNRRVSGRSQATLV